MSVSTGQVVVGITRVQIDGNDINPVTLLIHNLDSTKDLFIGGSDVTTANGYVINKGEELAINLPASTSIYMVSSGNDHNVSWMRVSHY